MRDHGRWASTSWEMTLTRVIEGRRCRRRRNETEGRKEGRRDGRWKVKGEKTTKFFRSDPYHGRTLWRQWCSAVGYRWKSSNQRERPRGCGFWRQSFVFFESCNASVRVYPQYVYTDSYIYICIHIYLYEYFHRRFAFALQAFANVFIFDEDASGRSFLSFHSPFFLRLGLIGLLSVLWNFSSQSEAFMRQLVDRYRSIFVLDQSFFEYSSTTRHFYRWSADSN